ncbi:MAG TPA: gamma-glutamylcyclotransferase [Comamonadaceae bacterium]|uniref:gamma-glutamylcyclotransferase n=1 Tax=Pulveribacter sp. TaxID=2678893 RepID=UPI000EE00651|nr:gamma-glutamylcyclotransferase [Pulveribacter sp.]HCL85590.1 gamma-glutamylcyclotransferase [Comamonadaceae bacterium]
MPTHASATRDPAAMLECTLREWGGHQDLWIFGYGSLIWRPEFPFAESRPATVHGWHRALKMWSRVNRGTPECPGLVFGMLPGGSCRGVAFRVERRQVPAMFPALWQREMVLGVYDPRWLACRTPGGTVRALAFTLSRNSPSHTGVLPDAQYRSIFRQARGIYGSTLDYAETTHAELMRMGIHDRALARLLAIARSAADAA